MGFENLNKPEGHAQLDQYLADKSYIVGYTPSVADNEVFVAVSGGAPVQKYKNALRWFNHISSYSTEERKQFPGEKKGGANAYGGEVKVAEAAKATKAAKEEDDEDVDLFGSDDEEADAEAEKLKQERLEAYKAKKSAKPKTVAKSSIVLDVKPWDDETDMKALEEGVRAIEMEGLLWGAGKLVAVGYGIKKLQIGCVVVDDLVSTDDLEDRIVNGLEDYVQSMDIAAFQKI